MNAQNDVLILDYLVGTYLFGVTSTTTSLLLPLPLLFIIVCGVHVRDNKKNQKDCEPSFQSSFEKLTND